MIATLCIVISQYKVAGKETRVERHAGRVRRRVMRREVESFML